MPNPPPVDITTTFGVTSDDKAGATLSSQSSVFSDKWIRHDIHPWAKVLGLFLARVKSSYQYFWIATINWHIVILSNFPIVFKFFRGCVSEMFVASYSVTYCIYIPWKPEICFHYHCAVYDECKWSDTFWLEDRIRLFVHYTISLSSLYKLVWRHWTYKMPARYSLSSVWLR